MPRCSFLALYRSQAARIIAAMKKRRPTYSTPDQTAIDFAAPDLAPVEETSADAVAEGAVAGYSTAPGWIDTAGKTRTWVLYEPSGTKLAEITTKGGAEKLADLLNRVEGAGRNRSK